MAAGSRAGLIIQGPHTNVRRGPFSHTRNDDFFLGVHFSSPKKSTTFLVVVIRLGHKPNIAQRLEVKIAWEKLLVGWELLPWYNRHNG